MPEAQAGATSPTRRRRRPTCPASLRSPFRGRGAARATWLRWARQAVASAVIGFAPLAVAKSRGGVGTRRRSRPLAPMPGAGRSDVADEDSAPSHLSGFASLAVPGSRCRRGLASLRSPACGGHPTRRHRFVHRWGRGRGRGFLALLRSPGCGRGRVRVARRCEAGVGLGEELWCWSGARGSLSWLAGRGPGGGGQPSGMCWGNGRGIGGGGISLSDVATTVVAERGSIEGGTALTGNLHRSWIVA